jgi:hypothetical protein
VLCSLRGGRTQLLAAHANAAQRAFVGRNHGGLARTAAAMSWVASELLCDASSALGIARIIGCPTHLAAASVRFCALPTTWPDSPARVPDPPQGCSPLRLQNDAQRLHPRDRSSAAIEDGRAGPAEGGTESARSVRVVGRGLRPGHSPAPPVLSRPDTSDSGPNTAQFWFGHSCLVRGSGRDTPPNCAARGVRAGAGEAGRVRVASTVRRRPAVTQSVKSVPTVVRF